MQLANDLNELIHRYAEGYERVRKSDETHTAPRENVLLPRFSMTCHEGPAALTRRVSPASPGGRHSQVGGGDSVSPVGFWF